MTASKYTLVFFFFNRFIFKDFKKIIKVKKMSINYAEYTFYSCEKKSK